MSDTPVCGFQNPGLLNELLLYRPTVQARDAVEESGLSKREMIRRLGTSPSQFYRLLDPTYYGKSVGQLIGLFSILGIKCVAASMGSGDPVPDTGNPGIPRLKGLLRPA